MSNIKDVLHSPEDWQDFWENEDKNEEFREIPPYVEAILGLTDYPADCKRESPLSQVTNMFDTTLDLFACNNQLDDSST